MNVRRISVRAVAAALVAGGVAAGTAIPADAAASGSWPILDRDGVQRNAVSYNGDNQIAMACYHNAGDTDVAIEELFASGETAKRWIPLGGCAVAVPWAGTGPVVAVRGWVGDYANSWNYVS
jgi:hypothetical protein